MVMDATLWVLLFEDILLLVIIIFLLYLRQRPYAIIAAFIFVIILLINIIILRGFSNWFTLVLPCLLSAAIILIARPFLPRPRVTMGVRMTRGILVPSLLVFLFLTILFVTAILFDRR